MVEERKFIKIGHRGAAGYEPENTDISFEKAIKLGVDMIELDVRLCKSGELVVIHDDTLERTTNGCGRIRDKTLAELKKLDAGKGQKILTLRAALYLIDQRVTVNIELKEEKTALPAVELISIFVKEREWDRNMFLVSSFDHKELKRFRMFDPFTRVGLLFDEYEDDIFDLARTLRCYSINPSAKLTDEYLVNEAHKEGLRVFVWTANKPEDIQKLKTMGVDGIFSDFPDRLM